MMPRQRHLTVNHVQRTQTVSLSRQRGEYSTGRQANDYHDLGVFLGTMAAVVVCVTILGRILRRRSVARQEAERREEETEKQKKRQKIIELLESNNVTMEVKDILQTSSKRGDEGEDTEKTASSTSTSRAVDAPGSSTTGATPTVSSIDVELGEEKGIDGSGLSSPSVEDGDAKHSDEESLYLTLPGSPQRTFQVPNCCAICLESYECGQTLVWSPNEECSHAYHQECIVDYILISKTGKNEDGKVSCPTCRGCFITLPLEVKEAPDETKIIEQEVEETARDIEQP